MGFLVSWLSGTFPNLNEWELDLETQERQRKQLYVPLPNAFGASLFKTVGFCPILEVLRTLDQRHISSIPLTNTARAPALLPEVFTQG